MSLQVKCAKEMKGTVVLSTAFLPIFKFSAMRLFCKAISYRRFKRHSNAAGTASPLAIRSQLYSRWVPIRTARYFCPVWLQSQLRHFTTSQKAVHSRRQFLHAARHDATKWRILLHFLANAERCYRVPAAETTALRLSYHWRSSQLYLGMTVFLYASLFSHVRATCPANLVFFVFMTWVIPGMENSSPNLWVTVTCNFTASQTQYNSA